MHELGKKVLNDSFVKFLNAGQEMFMSARLAATEDAHCKIYYDFIKPERFSTIVDLGAGIGGHGARFQKIDPTLRVINVVNDESLIQAMNKMGRSCIHANYEETGLPDGCADVVMFNQSFGYGDMDKSLKEASRLLKYGGILTIFDYSMINETTFRNEEWDYEFRPTQDVINSALKNGMHAEEVLTPPSTAQHWIEIMELSKNGESVDLMPLKVMLYKFKKRNSIDMNSWFGGNRDAYELCHLLVDISHLWDDIIDKDKNLSDVEINHAFSIALIYLQNNNFYKSIQQTILPMLDMAVSAYMVANTFEREKDVHGLEISHSLRYSIGHIIAYSIMICIGREKAQEILPMVWKEIFFERIDDYRAEHLKK